MTDYCRDEARRKWNFGPNFSCDGDSNKCKYVVKFGKQEYCGWCPPRCSLHQVIKSQAGCLWCKYATKRLDYPKCIECLSSQERINFTKEVI